jgi:serine/threonine protein phosphatase PrpC
MPQFETQSATYAGGRSYNEDAVRHLTSNGHSCWMLADGLGGHGGGQEASKLATDAVAESFLQHAEASPAALATYLEAARLAVVRKQEEDPQLLGMRTTLVLLVSDGAQALWAHIGDSRLYYFRDGQLAARTFDHSVPQAMVDAGQLKPSQIRRHEDRNRLLRCLGGREELRATIMEKPKPVQPGDAFLLCSDGFWEYVTETAMEFDLLKSPTAAEWLFHMEVRLRTDLPEDCDNYSAVAIVARQAGEEGAK